MEHHLIVAVTKVHVVHYDIALEFSIFGFARVLMRVFPRPQAGALRALGKHAVFILFRVDEVHIAVVYFRRLIQQFKDALRARQRHDDGVRLLRDLVDRLVEALIQGQEGDQRANGQAEIAVGRQQTADHRAEHIAQVAHRHRQRHDGVGDAVCAVRAVAQSVVQLLEAIKVFLFVAEDLDDLLAVHHLFDIAVDLAQIHLLLHEEAARIFDALHGERHRRGDHEQRDDQQRHVEHHHRNDDADNHDDAGNQLRHGLGDHLAHGVDIVGVYAHDIAVGMRVKILDRQALHLGKELDAQVFQRALRDEDHQIVVQPRAERAEDIHRRHAEHRTAHRAEIRIRLAHHRGDIVVDQALHEHRAVNVGHGADEQADDDHDAVDLILAHDLGKDALKRLAGVLRAGLSGVSVASHHGQSPPFMAASSKSPPPLPTWLL